MKRPKRKKDWEGLRVRSLVDMQNGFMKIPKGAILTVHRNYAGLHLVTDPCPHCGVSVSITHVPERDVVIVE